MSNPYADLLEAQLYSRGYSQQAERTVCKLHYRTFFSHKVDSFGFLITKSGQTIHTSYGYESDHDAHVASKSWVKMYYEASS